MTNPEFSLTDRTSPAGDTVGDNLAGLGEYPSVSTNEVISWPGAGSLTLSSGTFDSNFVAGNDSRSYSNGISSALRIVPEPSSLALMGLGGVLLLGCVSQVAGRSERLANSSLGNVSCCSSG